MRWGTVFDIILAVRTTVLLNDLGPGMCTSLTQSTAKGTGRTSILSEFQAVWILDPE